ncbi:Hypothetical predicted protein, partial [Paramuricea clavata]
MFLFLSDTCQALGCHVKPLWRIFSTQSVWKDSSVQEVSLRCVDSLLKTGGLNFEAISDDLFTVVISCLQDITPGDNESARSEANCKLQKSLASVITTAIKPRTGHKRIPLVHVNSLAKAVCDVTREFDAVLCRELKFLAKCLSELVLSDLRQRKQAENNTIKRQKLEAMDIDLPENKIHVETFQDICTKYKLQKTTLNYLYLGFTHLFGVLNEQAMSQRSCAALDGLTLVFRTLVLLIEKPSVLGESILSIVTEVTNATILELKSAMLTVLDKLSSSMVRSIDGGDTVNGIMRTLLDLIKLLLYSHKHIAVSRELLNLSTCIASLPWIVKVNPEYATMVPCGNGWNLAKLKQLSSVLAKYMDPGTCLEVLTMFPPELMTKWKVHVFHETL